MKIEELVSIIASNTMFDSGFSHINKSGFEGHYQKSELLRRAAQSHSWTRATAITIPRAAVGAGLSFIKHPIFGKDTDDVEIPAKLKKVQNCFYGFNKNINYIQDLGGFSSKMYYTVLSAVLYGQFAWEKLRVGNRMVGFDVLPGITMPHVDQTGKFLTPAYYFRPWNSQAIIEYENPDDLVYCAMPGIDYNVLGGTDYDALTNITIPSDLYASQAYKFQFENMNAPYNGVWVVDPNTNDDDYKTFATLLAKRYTGIGSFGRNPLLIRGNVDFKETRSRSNDDAPYLQGREYNQIEESAVTGVSSAKLGMAEDANKTNFRELRRDFHENTLRPVFQIIEESVHSQVFVYEFNLPEYKLAFNRPDLSTALEEATIIGRYVQNGIYNPNEARQILGKQPRKDEFGTKYFIPRNGEWVDEKGMSNLAGQSVEKPDESDISETIVQNGSNRIHDPLRTDDDSNYDRKSEIINELRKWKKFQIRVNNGERENRNFVSNVLDSEISNKINTIVKVMKAEQIADFFDNAINEFVDLTNNQRNDI